MVIDGHCTFNERFTCANVISQIALAKPIPLQLSRVTAVRSLDRIASLSCDASD